MKRLQNKIKKLELQIEKSEAKIEIEKKALKIQERLELKTKNKIVLKIEKSKAKIKILEKELRKIEENLGIRALLICQQIHNNHLDLLELKRLKSTTNK